MGNSLPKGIRSALGAISVAVACVGLGVSLSGCPVAAPLENEERFEWPNQSGTGNTAGSGAVDCNQPLPDGPGTPEIGCDYQAFMRSHCARGGCHNVGTHSGDLDLTLDSLLIARIVDRPARHKITCVGIGQCDLTAPQCAGCMMCPPGPTYLVSKAEPANSWMIHKMNAFNVDTPTTAPDIGCGTAMPYPPGGTGFTAERRTCLTNFFTWVANNGRACAVATGGSGGGGAGGAGAGGAGSGSGGAGGT
jgi:hypothetical protein